MSSLIRPETPADTRAVRAVVADAFGEQAEADLVELLRASAGYLPELALVAEDDTGITGHIMLTGIPLYEPDGGTRTILCLSPLSVRPDRQGQGIGRALTEHALRLADERLEPFVVLEGDPALYHRFGFVAASDHGLLRPSPTIPEPAFQVRLLDSYKPSIRGRVGYPAVFWAAGGAGLPEPVEAEGPFTVPWLFQLARYAGWIEAATASADLNLPVPARNGRSVDEVLRHLGVSYRVVGAWIQLGRRPVEVASEPDDGDIRAWFGRGWRDLYAVLAATPRDTPAASWSPHDTTIGFWRRRMVHETAIHAHDVLAAVTPVGPLWTVPEAVALDGIDEALRLWLGTRLGGRMAGTGRLVRIVVGAQADAWTVGVHRHITEVHRLPTPADARLEGSPAAVYAWLWGRESHDDVRITGDATAVNELRRALDLSMSA
jgi:predicted N-acetyltransferase YhbS